MSTVKASQRISVSPEILSFLGVEKGELSGIDKTPTGQLALNALELLEESIAE